MPPGTPEQDRWRPELHAYAPKRVTTQCAAIDETKRSKAFVPEPKCGEGTLIDAPKRVTTPAGIAADGARALSFRPEKPSSHIRYYRLPTIPESGSPSTIWVLPLPKRRRHQDPPTPALRHPHDQREGHHHRHVARRRKRPRGPPPGAAAPASKISYERCGRAATAPPRNRQARAVQPDSP